MNEQKIPELVRQQAQARPDSPAYYTRDNGTWTPTAWRDFADEINMAARAMIASGVEHGDSVCILGFNRPSWIVADHAAMAVGASPAGVYTTNSPSEVQYIASHCEAKLIFLENRHQWEKVDKVRDELPELKHAVMFKGAEAIDDPLVLSWEEFLKSGEGVDASAVDERIAALKDEDVATLIYTSGTTGPPKGVMLTHHNLAWTAGAAIEMVRATPEDCALSYLPLSHIAEQMFSVHGPAAVGYAIYFAESIDDVAENLKEVQPTIFFGVPRIWEKFHAGITGKLREATGVKKVLVNWAQKVGTQANLLKCEGKEPTGMLALQYKLADKLIYSKLKPAVGLGRAKVCVSGAAPVSKEVIELFLGLDLIVHEVYGQSEDCGPTTFNQPGMTKIGTVGPPVPGVEVRIADDGEIMVKGPNVFKGYYKNPEATAETLTEDGWMHSGDLGSFDGPFLTITGRKKEIIITAGGKNVAPKNIEAALKNHDLINEAVVIGDRRKYLSALVTIDPEAAPAWAEKKGLSTENLHENEQLIAELQAHVDEINKEFAKVETIKRFKVLERNLSVEDGELTPTLKVKRRKVYEHFADDIESLYS